MFAFSNNGFTMRTITDGMQDASEVTFDFYPSEADLQAAFPGRATALAAERIKQTRVSLTQALQDYMDETAQERDYDGIVSLCSYATSSNPRFGPEGRAGVIFRDAVWDYGNQIVNSYEAGTLPAIPTAEEVVAGAPRIIWPS